MNTKVIKVSTIALIAVFGQAAWATIDNEATVTGTYGTEQVTDKDDEKVDVAPAAPDLTITKTAVLNTNIAGDDRAQAGDTITYTFVIKNDGNVTMSGVTPVDAGPSFNTQTMEGTLSSFTVNGTDPAENTAALAPGASATFTATYTLADLDVYHAADVADGVTNTAAAKGTTPQSVNYTDADTDDAKLSMPYKAEIDLVKSFVLDDTDGDDKADVGEKITYTYTVTNTGNVPLSDVTVGDTHEGTSLTSGTDITSEALTSDGPLTGTTAAASTDTTADDGVWTILQPEGVVTFTYIHTVTQDEVDNG